MILFKYNNNSNKLLFILGGFFKRFGFLRVFQFRDLKEVWDCRRGRGSYFSIVREMLLIIFFFINVGLCRIGQIIIFFCGKCFLRTSRCGYRFRLLIYYSWWELKRCIQCYVVFFGVGESEQFCFVAELRFFKGCDCVKFIVQEGIRFF